MDIGTIVGILLGTVCILIGQALEGGNIGQLLQVTAAFIVFGGTAGAVVLSFPTKILKDSMIYFKKSFFNPKVNPSDVIQEIIVYAQKARKEGVIALEKDARNAEDILMKMGLEAVSDGADPSLVRDLLETKMGQMEEEIHAASKVWEGAGGYSPTIGIIGAVLGLIQVMQNLSDPSKLGAGIAVAFVATVYGVGFANLIAIPMSTRIQYKAKEEFLAKQIIIEGILSIQAGESPALIERKLKAFLLENEKEA
ncbi:MAG: flagellar motor protein [Candidatus Gastranaerophilales bacterium]|nr:flagellar motor protein [Candidatus Gastranaerophilales bacterium]